MASQLAALRFKPTTNAFRVSCAIHSATMSAASLSDPVQIKEKLSTVVSRCKFKCSLKPVFKDGLPMKCKTYKKLSKQINVVFNARVVSKWIGLAIQVHLYFVYLCNIQHVTAADHQLDQVEFFYRFV